MNKKIYGVLVLTLFCQLAIAQLEIFDNPVLSGFHPDPSVVRVGDDYYLVNSSFEWFPGIPIFHSKDLVNWEQIGYVLDRPSQLDMSGNRSSSGIWAPTIRYHEGMFYVSVTCKQCKNDCNCGDNFYVTAENPAGPWSDPVWIDGSQHSIDPTLYFEDDKVYYIGNRHRFAGQSDPGQHQIFIQELDLENGKLLGESTHLTYGHATNAFAAEGPHLYKVNGKYLLLISEGGTWHNHAITTFVSDSILGPYEPTAINPAITHRHLGENYSITTIGHADLVEDQNGQWWSLLLGVRPVDGYNILGRETFLTPVKFEGIQPVFNVGKGKVLEEEIRPALPWTPWEKQASRDEFNEERLSFNWNFLRTPQEALHSIKKGNLYLKVRPEKLTEASNPSLVARRIEHYKYQATTRLKFSPSSNEEAGIVAIQNDRFNYRLILTMEGNNQYVKLIKAYSKKRKELKEEVVAQEPYKGDEIVFRVVQNRLNIKFWFGETEENLRLIGENQDARVLASNVAGGFTGPYVGMYASSNGEKSRNTAAFDWFEYLPQEKQFAEEVDGNLVVEAEDYFSQTNNQNRQWYIINSGTEAKLKPEVESHLEGASGGSYLELLPDSRVTHADKLVPGINFSNHPGIAIVDYKVKIKTPGRYYVWVKAYSHGTEDNGVHVGLDGEWPESGQRMQWCKGKKQWTWDSKQRTKEVHCGVEKLIYLDIHEPGEHIISFSMREDGFEMDQWGLNQNYEIPELK
ncbi:glycoside hydrolase family 43 protein [Reichenbachiella ulvae]|uniref:Glycoside hydrolase family 43 protein n=1 Tax=Reichenbachiella ulvae TaxID=2980104 RepID=A0ABT3D1F7_9BACT|nr:glycoside hydrolase family 43 protein [Reichenbachiella ulvae]MCV9389278.1 glycoside hydrolase family 43 protein [Reichenbachiella ulvae]